jgi:hypothetical protein
MAAAINAGVLDGLQRTQRDIERLYELEPGPDVAEFVHFDAEQCHETVLVRQPAPDTLEVLVLLPASLQRHDSLHEGDVDDDHLQLIEGVSHFVLLTERARTELPATQLELEIQAEVDKFALLATHHGSSDPHGPHGPHGLSSQRARELHRWLFEGGQFLHGPDTVAGRRYRHANDVAARLCARLDLFHDAPSSQALLRRFYRCGQAEKLRLAMAA